MSFSFVSSLQDDPFYEAHFGWVLQTHFADILIAEQCGKKKIYQLWNESFIYSTIYKIISSKKKSINYLEAFKGILVNEAASLITLKSR